MLRLTRFPLGSCPVLMLTKVKNCTQLVVIYKFRHDKPPAPTSCTETIGLKSSSMYRSLLDNGVPFLGFHRSKVKAFTHCTAIYRRSWPRPINIAGPPNTMSKSPAHLFLHGQDECYRNHQRSLMEALYFTIYILFESTEIKAGRPNSLLNAAPPNGP